MNSIPFLDLTHQTHLQAKPWLKPIYHTPSLFVTVHLSKKLIQKINKPHIQANPTNFIHFMYTTSSMSKANSRLQNYTL